MSPSKKDAETSPESKKLKLIDEILAPMHLKRQLFKNEEAYHEYLQCFGELKGSAKIVANQCIDLELKADEAMRKLVESNLEKNQLDSVIYCNCFRRQMEQIESIFGKPQFQTTFLTFLLFVEEMVPFFKLERKIKDGEMTMKDEKNKNPFSCLSRVEKWRVIIFWFFTGEGEIRIEEETEDDRILKITNMIKREEKNIASDLKSLGESTRYKTIDMLKYECLTAFKIIKSKGLYFILFDEIKGIGKAFSNAFQRCSKELKRFENVTNSNAECVAIGQKIIGSYDEEEDDYIIHKCMDLMVTLRKQM